MRRLKGVAIVFAMLFVAAVLIGCSSKIETTTVPGTNTPTGDAASTAGLANTFNEPQTTATADPTANLPTSSDVANAVK